MNEICGFPVYLIWNVDDTQETLLQNNDYKGPIQHLHS